MEGFNFKKGEEIYKYQLQDKIGSGGFGEVWLAYDQSIANLVAIKLLDVKTVSIDERLQEARIGNRLNHPNLVKIHYADVVDYEGSALVIIVMDYHNQGSVVSNLKADTFLTIPSALKYSIDVLRGLEYLHEQNMFHNDIKPSNILLGFHNEAVLTDYGITCYSPDKQPVQPKNFYRLHAAPETLIQDRISIQTDIYQTGLTVFRLLNGIGLVHNKFDHVNSLDEYIDLVQRGIISQKDYQPFIPRNLKSVINKAIDPDPSKRYSSALDFRRALEKICYPGFWSIDSSGHYIGEDNKYTYRFEIQANGYQKFNFTAFKTSKNTGRITKMSVYSAKDLLDKDLSSLRTAFMQSIVTGKASQCKFSSEREK